jgi:hypothetical protein
MNAGYKSAGLVSLSFLLAACGGGDSGGGSSASLDLGKMWVATGDGNQIEVVDTGKDEVQSIDAGAQVVHIAVGAGAVWASTDQNTLLRVDPSTRSIVATVTGFFDIRSVAATADGVWVADNGDGTGNNPPAVRHVDPTSNAIVASVAAHQENDEYHTLLASSAGLYLQIDNAYAVVRIDPTSGSVKESLDLGKQGGYGYGELALDGDSVWTADQSSDVLHQLTASPLAAKAEFPIEARFDGYLAAGAGSVFIGDSTANTVGVFDPSDGSLTREIDAGETVKQLAVRNGILVVALSYTGNGVVLLVDPKSGKQVGELHAVYARELAFE